jgi:hypothetical protein
MALEAFKGKMVFSSGLGVVLEFFEWLEGLWHKRHASSRIWEFFGDFHQFF